jgi:hypothetical protein
VTGAEVVQPVAYVIAGWVPLLAGLVVALRLIRSIGS